MGSNSRCWLVYAHKKSPRAGCQRAFPSLSRCQAALLPGQALLLAFASAGLEPASFTTISANERELNPPDLLAFASSEKAREVVACGLWW